MSNEEKIAMGECVSPLTADHCRYCVDTCQAFKNRCNFSDLLHELKIKESPGDKKDKTS